MTRSRLWVVLLAGVCLPVSASDYGTTGLIDTPTARMQSDGTFSATAAFDGRHRQFAITYQATPWLEGTFRYTGYSDYFFWDRNYEFKARLWEEELYLPQVAVGIRDIVGTGNFGSEYLVASKQIGRTDITLGVGWGRLAGSGLVSNPLAQIDDRFETRDQFTGQGGEFSLGQFFSGNEIGVFGGVSHKLTSFPVIAMLEYNPDRYDSDFRNGVPRPASPWSAGLTWDALPGVAVTASYQHQEEVGLAFRFSLDSSAEPPRRAPNEFISSYYLSQADLPPQINKNRWYDRLLYDVERSGLFLVEGTISEDGQQAQLVVGNGSYPLWSDAIGRLTALADLHLPATVKTVHFVVEDAGHRTITVVVPRPSTSYSNDQRSYLRGVRLLSGRTLKVPQHRTGFATGKINNTVNLRTRFQLFDPDDPARYQVYADFSSEYSLNAHWAIRSTVSLNIDQNFDESNRQESDSVLPKVRSDVVRYLNEGASGLDKLFIEGRDTYRRSIHYRGFAGILEEMYSGAGGEALFWPTESRIALGASVAYAKQRDYDRRLGHLDYEVITGHLSAYWASPFYNYDVAVHAGRYLAKDAGATLEVRRTFRNGWQVGAWATMTDVSSEDFGEGSFDKGFYFQVPLDAVFGGNTRSKFGTRMRPIQRDGGQRLEAYSGNIFWDLREARYDAFTIDERLVP
ncbi:YjbH domain-containing protein [Luminiphilus sp.]|nr:YjbH domain-containing protein [Luminiphilus sp.]